MSTLKVDAIRHNSATSDAITTAADGTCTARITGMTGGGQLSHRNIIINGAMMIAQRGTSSTSTNYATVDRFRTATTGVDEACTYEQVDDASGTTPYTLGFRKAFKITNGNQTSGAGATDRVEVMTRLEAQDIANSGWNYTSSSSFVTLSFWIKSSVAQNFFARIQSQDGTAQRYAIETGSLTADTWTKITKTIPGNSNLQFDNNSAEGLRISLYGFLGTNNTDSSSLNTWAASADGNRTPDQTSTWYTTNDATLEMTGFQLEVGDTATSFEHRSYGEELSRCQRYYEMIGFSAGTGVQATVAFGMQYTTNGSFYGDIVYKQTMRAIPTLDSNNTTGDNETFELFSASNSNGIKFNSLDGITGQDTRALTVYKNSVSATGGDASYLRMEPDAGKTFGLSAEL